MQAAALNFFDHLVFEATSWPAVCHFRDTLALGLLSAISQTELAFLEEFRC